MHTCTEIVVGICWIDTHRALSLHDVSFVDVYMQVDT
jgi:hypothetical protein